MDSEEPFALLITWTCYGTWLPGDKRGYVSDTFGADDKIVQRNNLPGTAYTANDEATRQVAVARQKWPSVTLSRPQAEVVARSLLTAAKTRDWRILRAAVMYNHVHALVMQCPDDGPAVRRVLKGVSQSQLSNQLGRVRRWWTHRGSDRYLHREDAIEGAIRYVAEQHGILAAIQDMKMIPGR